jgi:hypothetical protein
MGCLQKLANAILTLVVLAALLAAAAWYFLLPQLDVKLADAVRREFMLPPSSTVIIERGSLADTLEGQLRRFHVSSPEAKIADTPVEDLEFEAKGIRFDLAQTFATGKADLQDVDYGEMTVKVSQSAIQQRWAGELEKRGVRKPEVELDNDKVKLSGLVDLKLAKLRVAATGRLIADGTERIKFEATELDMGGANVEIKQLRSAITSLTPVIDVGQFKLSILVDEVKTEDGYLFIRARSRGLKERLDESGQAVEDEQTRLEHEEEVLRQQLADIEARKKAAAEAEKEKEKINPSTP